MNSPFTTIPLSTLQREVWLDQALHPDLPHYNAGVYNRIDGTLDIPIFQRALESVVNRHDALRVVLVSEDELPRQKILAHVKPELTYLDFSKHEDPEANALNWIREKAQEPFVLLETHLFFFALLKVAEDRYYWLTQYHHLIVDGWTLTVLVEEMAEIYNVLSTGHEPPEQIPTNYAEFVADDEAYRKSDQFRADEAFWKNIYSTLPEPLFHRRHQVAPADEFRAHQAAIYLDASLCDELRAFVTEHGTTLSQVFLGALYGYFACTFQRDDVALGLFSRNRQEKFANTAGLFVNTYSAWYRLSRTWSFDDVLRAIGENARRGAAFRRFPMSDLMRAIGLLGTERARPFDVTVSFLGKNCNARFGTAPVEVLTLSNGYHPHGLVVYIEDTHAPGRIRLLFDGNCTLFSPRELKRIAERFAFFLAAAIRDAHRPITHLPLMPEAEELQVLEVASGKTISSAESRPVHQWIAARAAETPQAIAVEFGAEAITYGELNARANRWAHLLRAQGVGPEVFVGSFLPRSIDMIVAMLAIWKAGGAYVPLDPEYPRERLAVMLASVQAPVILTFSSLLDSLPPGPFRTICMDQDELRGSSVIDSDIDERGCLDNAAYAIFTSGSSGTPKSVVVTHTNLEHLALRLVELLALRPQDRILQFTASSWDTSFEEIVPCLVVGAQLVLRRPEMLDPIVFLRECHERRISIVDLPTAFFHELVHVLTNEILPFPTALHTVVVGGEAVRSDKCAEFLALAPHRVRLFNTFGSTEATAVSTAIEVREIKGPVSIGFPLPNVDVHVLDSEGQPTPFDTVGEMFISGAGVSRGYLGHPALTAERFVPNPFSSLPGARMYRTGDLAERSDDGRILFHGRADQQIKIRGMRVEPGEIEAVLATFPGVREALVDMRPMPNGMARLVAYVIPNSGNTPFGDELIRYASMRLPAFMIPTAIVFLENWPRLATGKINRGVLPEPADSLETKSIDQTLRFPVEEIVAGAFADVLGTGPIGRQDDFFRLGGHSLLAMRLMSTLQKRLGYAPPMAAVFRHSTVRALAAYLHGRDEKNNLLRPKPRNHTEPAYEGLSSLERRLWFLERLHPEARAYAAPQAIKVLGPLDLQALRASLHVLALRQEILRTTYSERDGEPIRCVANDVAIPMTLDDITSIPAAEKPQTIRQKIADEISIPFDLTAGPLTRVRVLRLSTSEHILLVNHHHIITDEWSAGVFLREWSALYEATRKGQGDPLPPLLYQYAEFARAEQEALATNFFDSSRRYWKEHLRAVPRLELPWFGSSRAPGPEARIRIHVDTETSQSLQTFAQAQGRTIFMVWYAAILVLFSRLTQQTDFALGSVAANRDAQGANDLLGFFTNRLILRTDLSGDPTFLEIVRRAGATAIDAYRNQAVPFDIVVQDQGIARRPGEMPFYDVSFFQLPIERAHTAENWSSFFDILPDGVTTAKNALSIVLIPADDGADLLLTYDTSRIQGKNARRLLDCLAVVVTKALEHPSARLSEMNILPPEEFATFVARNSALCEYRVEACIHEFFEKQVELRPDARAVEYRDEHLTYRELNARSNTLAHHLRRLGVGPEVLVGLCIERSVEVIIGLLAILKAGGAYVPLDSAWPRERIAQIVDDVHLPLVLTSSRCANRLPKESSCLVLDTLSIADDTSNPRLPNTGGRHAAYVLFTSGSTGKPKGVVVEHRQLVEYVLGIAERFGLEAELRYGLVSTLAADLGHTALFPALALGGTLCILPETQTMSPDEWAQEFAQSAVDILKITPSHLAALLAVRSPERLLPRKRLVLGGEVTRWDLVDTITSLAPECVVTNHYGPTETTVGVLTLDVQPDDHRASSVGPALGKSRPNVGVYVLDAHLAPVPVGITGELYIGGLALARGYHSRPQSTAEKFVPDPYSSTPGARMYRTGDLVRWNDDGNIEFIGRSDHQIKIRGFRVELGEIEAALLTHDSVRECVVLAHEVDPNEKRLIAYVVGDEGRVDRDILAAHLQKKLPEYMVPAEFVFLSTLPLTVNGKIDRRVLPIPASTSAKPRTHTKPRNAIEQAIVSVWEKLFGVESIGITDDFFALGGHSLLALRCLALLEKQIGIALPVATLFDHSTVEALARTIEGSSRNELFPSRLGLLPREQGESAYPGLFSTERRLWFLQRLYPRSLSYQAPILFRLRGVLDLPALRASIAALVERHEILRTTYPESHGLPIRHIASTFDVPFALHDISATSSNSRELALDKIIRDEITKPFDIEREPPVRIACIRESADNHLVMWLQHHIVSDEWSGGILMRELVQGYERASRKESLNLPAFPFQFADVARAENAALDDDRWAASRSYWKEKLARLPRISWPFLRPANGKEPGPEGRVRFRVSAEVATATAALGRRYGCTPFMAWYAIFTAVLSRYTREVDFAVGTVVANRDTPGTEDLLGFFTNTVVLRTNLADDPTVQELLIRARQTTVEAYRHQAMPFDVVARDQGSAWSDHESPPFDVSIFEVSAPRVHESPSWSIEREERFENILQGLTTAKDALGIAIEQTDDGLQLHASFDTIRVEREAIERLLGHMQTMAADAVRFPEKRLSQLSYLSADEITRFRQWNDTAAPYPSNLCIHTLFAEQAAKTPEALAVIWGREKISYRELDHRAEVLARHLRSLGVAPDVLVGLCFERSADMIVAMLGILKAGGAYVPLDPALPDQRLQFILEDTGAPIVVTQAPLVSRLQAIATRLVYIDDFSSPSVVSTNEFSVDVTPRHLAYVVYTSGSTGEPKGVMIEHQSLVAHVSAYIQFHGLTSKDRVLALTPPHFDASVEQIFPALACGAGVVIGDWDFEPQSFSEKLIDFGVTLLDTSGAHWRALVSKWLEDPQLAERLRLRTMMVGGDVMPAEVLSQWRRTHFSARTRLVNVYGPTETTVAATAYEVTNDFDVSAPRIPIGKPYANRTVFVLDEQLQPVPIGIPGELFIGGIGPARGYLNQPALTAERFLDLVSIPSANDLLPGAGQGKVYRTGDSCRWIANGTLDFLGRTDNQIKIRGYRVELGEIEALLRRFPGVDDAVVVVREQGLHRALIAYVVTNSGGPNEIAQTLASFLRQTLPEHMIPSRFVVVPAIPRSPTTGKVDRARLPDPFPAAESARTEPRTQTEKSLAEIYQQLLKIDQVAVDNDFFELGGHSLLATQLVSRIDRVFSIRLPLSSVFQLRTLEALAGAIDDSLRERGSKSAIAVIPSVQRDKPLPLSFGQERLLFLDRMNMGAAFHVPLSMRIEGPLDIAAFRWSFSEIVRRHESLRTSFLTTDDGPRQIIRPSANFSLPVVDLRVLPPNEKEAEVSRRALAEVRKPFDLSRNLLLRGTLLWLADEPIPTYVLLATIHHIVSDGWSLDIFARELETLYKCHLAGSSSPLPELTLQVADVASFQREHLNAERLANHIDYWRKHLDGAPFLLRLPFEVPQKSNQARGSYSFCLDEELTKTLRALADRAGVTMFMLLLAAFQVLLGRCADCDDVIVGTPVHGRNREELENLIGFFVNNLPIRTNFADDPPFLDLLRRVRQTIPEALEHGEVPFEKIVEFASPERDSSRHPIFQVVLAFHEVPGQTISLPGLRITPIEVAPELARLDLELHFEPRAGCLEGFMLYDAGRFDSASMRNLGERFLILLRGIVEAPESRVHALPLLTPREQAQMFGAWNDTTTELRDGMCAHELIVAQAKRTPEALAVFFDDGSSQSSLTYRELITRSNRLAHYLRQCGIGPEKLVGSCLKPGPDVIVGLLAILIAGGAYLPLDSAYPTQRLEFMLQDARPDIVMTQAAWVESLPASAVRYVCLDRDAHEIAAMPDNEPSLNVHPDNLAYVIYTSGSTGKPKGVLVPHRGLVNVAQAQRHQFQFGPGDRVLQWSSLNFDSAIAEIWMTLAAGATLCIGSRDQVLPGQPLLDFLARHEISMVTLTPSALVSLSEVELPKLHTLAVAGEACVSQIVDKWAPGRRFFNLYGPTEATIWSTVMECKDSSLATVIGRPIQNTQVYVLDRHLQPVPPETPGELYLAGLGITRGYSNQPALTAQRFLPNPFGDGRLYRTGDRVRWRADGYLEFLGRKDQQIKLRGFRIELGEIEATLAEHPDIGEAAVIVRDDKLLGPSLSAYVVPRSANENLFSVLRDYLRTRLPEFMIPSFWMILDALPRSLHGKVDRHALPALDQPSHAQDQIELAHSPTEKMLADIWCAVLGIESVGISQNFFELGGHSLLVAKVATRVRRACGCAVPLPVFFTHTTIVSLARWIDAEERISTRYDAALRPAPGNGPFPLSLAQERIWILHERAGERTQYNMPMAIRLVGKLDIPAFERSFVDLVRRHEALRTNFILVNDQPMQIVRDADFHVHYLDLRSISKDEQSLVVQRLAFDDALRPFDLAHDSLFRITLLHLLDDTEFVMLLNMHHIVSDGSSMGILMREFAVFYEAHRQGSSPLLPSLPIQYKDYAVWQRSRFSEERRTRQIAYWRKRLESAPLTLGRMEKTPRPVNPSPSGRTAFRNLPEAVVLRLRTLSNQHEVTLFTTLLATFMLTLSHLAGQSNVVVGTPMAHREQIELEGVCGRFLSVLVLHAKIDPNFTFVDLLAHVRETIVEALEYQDITAGKLDTLLFPERDFQQYPLVPALFNMIPSVSLRGRLAGIDTFDVEVPGDEPAKYPLTLYVSECEGDMNFRAIYKADLFTDATIAGMLDELCRVMTKVAANPLHEIGALGLQT